MWEKSQDFLEWLHEERQRMEQERQRRAHPVSGGQMQELSHLQAEGFHITWRHVSLNPTSEHA